MKQRNKEQTNHVFEECASCLFCHCFVVAGDDSDAFADDEAPSSDGMEERDDVSLVSTVSSVGEDDNYLSEPTYNNLDPVWAQRHGFGPGGAKVLTILLKLAKFFTILPYNTPLYHPLLLLYKVSMW